MRHLLTLIVCLIIYGSLYPFNFNITVIDKQLVLKLFNFSFGASSFTDSISNIILFMPFGFLATKIYLKKTSFYINTMTIIAAGFILAFGIQVAQLLTPDRVPSGSDATWNTIGCMIGMAFANIKLPNTPYFDRIRQSSLIIPFSLACALILYNLAPFVPSLDFQLFKNNIKSLLLLSNFNVFFTFEKIILWLVSFYLLEQTALIKNKNKVFIFIVTFVLVVKLFLINNGLSIDYFIAAITSLTIWLFAKPFITNKTIIVALILAIIVMDFEPFQLSSQLGSFSWIPFSGSLGGNLLINILAVSKKIIIYASLIWLLVSINIQIYKSTLIVASSIFILEYLQILFVSAVPEITDSLLVILSAFIINKLNTANNRDPEINTQPPHEQSVLNQVITKTPFYYKWKSFINEYQSTIKTLIIFIVVMVFIQNTIMSLPNIPYNILELYQSNGTIPDFIFFSIAIVLFGAGSAWLAHSIILVKPTIIESYLYCFTISSITLILLRFSITNESVYDLIGSSVFVERIIKFKILGEIGVDFVTYFGAINVKAITQLIEPFIRFAAFIGPVIVFIVIILATYLRPTTENILKNKSKFFIEMLIRFLPWLILCKIIAFDVSSTDNLNELFARDNENNIGGGGAYIYALLFLTCFCAVSLALATIKFNKTGKFVIAVICIVSVPVGWHLISNGMTGDYTKYGIRYTGIDFLLGPNREVKLDRNILFYRWCVLHVAAMLAINSGIYLYLKSRISIVKNQTKNEHKTNSKNFSFIQNINFALPKLRYPLLAVTGITLLLIVWLITKENNSIITSPSWSHKGANFVFDHHIHTNYSDGKLTVKDAVELAYFNGCNAIAISDHSEVKKAASLKQINELRVLRDEYPGLLIFAGLEIGMPSYFDKEHVGVLVSPSIEKTLLPKVMVPFIKYKTKKTKITDQEVIDIFSGYQNDFFAIYNHPSRLDKNESTNMSDIEKWNNTMPFISALSGAPGHQKARPIGSYKKPLLTKNRWDPAVATIGSTWDELLSSGKQIWGAIASSDFHGKNSDFAPCSFSRIHIIAPDQSYTGLLSALHAGTFWADHGKIVDQLSFSVELNGLITPAYPGSIVRYVNQGEISVANFEIKRGIGSINSPLEIDLISNCITGKVELMNTYYMDRNKHELSALLPLMKAGQDKKSCYVRVRVKKRNIIDPDLMAYTNHIRFIFN